MVRNKILLLGARSVRDPLPHIADELRDINELFETNSDYIPFYDSSINVSALQQILRTNNNKTLIIHFAGHSNSEALETDNEIVYAHHLANLIGTWKYPPDLLFLNGCNSTGQVNDFLEAGIACVIATQNFVDDSISRDFARNIYKHLLNDKGTVLLETAFKRAQYDCLLPNKRRPRSLDAEDLENPPSFWDWGLFTRTPDVLKSWTLSHPVVGNHQTYSPSNWLAMGEDDYGSYADLKVSKITQRFRWIVSDNKGFWLADTECTQALWQSVMNDNPAEFKLSPEHPIERVSWSKVQLFLLKLNALLPNSRARLPTEEEWELACRAGTETSYSFGETVTQDQVNFDGHGTKAVNSLPPNAWGMYAMHGNVWEWCQDGDDRKVIRGGCWASSSSEVKSNIKGLSLASNRDYTIGFRLLLDF